MTKIKNRPSYSGDLYKQISLRKLKVAMQLFKSKYRDEYVDLLREHLEKGFSFKSFAGVVRVRHSTIYRWNKRHEEFKNMKEMLAKKRVKCENKV